METVTFKQLTRFPVKNGIYLATVVCKYDDDYFRNTPITFELAKGLSSYLQEEQIVILDRGLERLKDFKARLQNYIVGCPELKYIYHEVMYKSAK